MGSTPATPRRAPVRDSSPMKAASAGGGGSSPPAASRPTKMGRSYTVPAFFWPAGARFTVMRLTGNLAPQFFTAARTRSRASRTAASGRPTMSKAGSPPERKHSALTSYPATPLRPRERTVTTMGTSPPDSSGRARQPAGAITRFCRDAAEKRPRPLGKLYHKFTPLETPDFKNSGKTGVIGFPHTASRKFVQKITICLFTGENPGDIIITHERSEKEPVFMSCSECRCGGDL